MQLKYAADFQDTQPGDYLKKPVPTQNRFDDNSRQYTYNTTLEWWQEYTTIPPINWVDFTRRVVNGYFTNEGCEGKNVLNSVVRCCFIMELKFRGSHAVCGMCARLRLDSRTFESISVSLSQSNTMHLLIGKFKCTHDAQVTRFQKPTDVFLYT